MPQHFLFYTVICVMQMLSGYLRLSGLNLQRARVRSALADTNPAAAATRWSQTVPRRSYRVASLNSLWHIDSHFKLVRCVQLVFLSL